MLSDELIEKYLPLRPVDSTGIIAHQADDIYGLWDAFEKESGRLQSVPFWAIVWPGARLITRYIQENRMVVHGKSVLDIGAGCAVTATAAAFVGAIRVVANDTDPVACQIALRNSAANGCSIEVDSINMLSAEHIEWFDVVFASDMFYEKSQSADLFKFLKEQQTNGAVVFVADGGRPFTPRERLVPIVSAPFQVEFEIEGCLRRLVTLYTLVE